MSIRDLVSRRSGALSCAGLWRNRCHPFRYRRLVAFGVMALTFTTGWASTGDPSRSTNIALSQDGTLLINVNREADSIGIFR